LLLDLQQAALDGAHAGRADVAVVGGELLDVLTHVRQHRAQVLEVEQQHAVVIGDLEHQVEHAHLRVIEVQHAAQQQRAHVRYGGAHRVALLAKHIPQRGGAGLGRGQANTTVLQGGGQLAANLARLADAGQVTLDIGHEHRHANARESLGQCLKGYSLAGAGRAGDQPVSIGQARKQKTLRCAIFGNQ